MHINYEFTLAKTYYYDDKVLLSFDKSN